MTTPEAIRLATTHDAAAFRLMVDARIRVLFSKSWVQADSRKGVWREPIEDDPYAAARRAIVKAATKDRGVWDD